jgi:endonuclease G
MAQNVFQFSGPVTIHVNATPAVAPAREPALVPSIPGAVSEPEFREKTLKFDEDYGARAQHGYQADFLAGWTVPALGLNADHEGELLQDAAGAPWVIPYYHYSLVMNRDRRLVAWAASNVDYSPTARANTKTRKQYGGENWRLDPRVALAAPGLQIEDADFYAPAKKIDRGHIVRREDGAWGRTSREAEFGNSDTYHWTNCTPQSEAFNQSGKAGIWGQFEEHIQREVHAEGGRMSVFAGPVLSKDDPQHGYENGTEIQVPMEFWKVVVCVSRSGGHTEKLAYGFVFDQTEAVQRLGYERMNMEDYEIYQMPIREISKKTGVVFDASVLAADVLAGGGAPERIRGFTGKRVRSLQGVVLR